MSLTYEEIHDTFPSLKQTFDLVETRFSDFEKLLTNQNDSPLLYLGCGSSLSIAQSLAFMTNTLLNRPAMAIAGGELLVHTQRYRSYAENAILVVISRSGQTSEIINAIEKLRQAGVKFHLVSYCCTVGSPLAADSEVLLEMPWAFDRSVCQTRTVTNLYACGTLLIAKAAHDQKLIADLEQTILDGPAFLARCEPICEEIAARNWTHAVVLGDAEIGGLSQEASLAYKEICQLPSNFYNLLDSRHGPIVLFNDATLVVIAVADAASKLETDLVRDVCKKGSDVVVYSDQPLALDNITNIVFGTDLAHAARGIPFILINQLISYFKSKQTMADPDKPDGLDPWIKI